MCSSDLYGYMRIPPHNLKRSPNRWFRGWHERGVDITSQIQTKPEDLTHYDITVLRMIEEYGADYFALQDIWLAPWGQIIAQAKSKLILPESYKMPFPRKHLFWSIIRAYMRTTNKSKLIRWLELTLSPRTRPYW